MREIKFRGYNRKNKQWLYGFYLQNRGAHFVCPDEFATGKSWDDYEVDPETVGQFTGLTDKNGKEIYEGDVFKDNRYYTGPIHKIVYRNGQWEAVAADGCWLALLEDQDVYSDEIDYIEIVGNIHDNPELLEQREQCELAKTLPSCDKSQQS